MMAVKPDGMSDSKAGQRAAVLKRLPLVVLVGFLATSTVFTAVRTYEDVSRLTWNRPPGDFRVFYWAGDLMLTSDRTGLYDLEHVTEYRFEHRRAIGSFYNPPAFALVFIPFTFFNELTAARINLFLGVGVMIVVAGLLARLADGWLARAAVFLALVSFWPALVGVQIGHPTMLLAALAAAIVLLYERGQSASAGVLLGAVALKPSLFLPHAGLMFWREDKRAIVATAATAVVLVLGPFLVLGPGALRQYMDLISASREDAFTYAGSITAGAAFMFNWNGFIARLFVVDPRPIVVFPLYLLTAGLMIKAWFGGDFLKAWLAASVTAALVTPHFLFYDLMFILPAAVVLAMRDRSAVLITILALTHAAANWSMLETYDLIFVRPLPRDAAFIAVTPMLLVLLVYLAFGDEIGRAFSRVRRRPLETSEATKTPVSA